MAFFLVLLMLGAPDQKVTPMKASGQFDVKVTAQPQDAAAAGPFGRLFLAKQFRGDLQATAQGQMLGSQTPDGSGGYVALEQVSGTLHGKQGSFVLQHKGTMSKGGSFVIDVTVVPDSGTGELAGISGRMAIRIDGRDHFYEFEYTLGN
jgi:hypothetical protein